MVFERLARTPQGVAIAPRCSTAIIMDPCECHGNHAEFAYRREDALMWDLKFDTFGWDSALRSIAAKAYARGLHTDIVEAMENVEKRLGSNGHWYAIPNLRQKLKRLCIN